jgi:copper chaperone
MQVFIIAVEGMTCGHCERAAEHVLAELPGVVSVTADRTRNEVSVSVQDGVDLVLSEVAEVLAEEGYTASGIRAGSEGA